MCADFGWVLRGFGLGWVFVCVCVGCGSCVGLGFNGFWVFVWVLGGSCVGVGCSVGGGLGFVGVLELFFGWVLCGLRVGVCVPACF